MTPAMRPAHLVDLAPPAADYARGQNFTVEAIRADAGDTRGFAAADECILLSIDARVVVVAGGEEAAVAAASAAIVPPGEWTMRVTGGGRVYVLTTGRADRAAASAANGAHYEPADARVAPVGAPFRRRDGGTAIRVHAFAELPFPPGNPRLKFLQSATMSINWVDYAGVRDRTALSPHAHDDFEQGSLAVEGRFVHHLRTPWKANANQWRDDEHLAAVADTLLIVPPEIVHTTEGLGDGRHVLVDIFAPPRRDFIAKGWMHNAGDYADPALDA